jgi:hypothetical protein
MDTEASRPTSLGVLLEDVFLAREVLRGERLAGATQAGVMAAQRALCASLSVYNDALEARGLPVPHAMHDELNLYLSVVRAYNRI